MAQTGATALSGIHTSTDNAKKFATELGKAIVGNTKVKAKYAGIVGCTKNWEKLQKDMQVSDKDAGTGLTGGSDCPAASTTTSSAMTSSLAVAFAAMGAFALVL